MREVLALLILISMCTSCNLLSDSTSHTDIEVRDEFIKRMEKAVGKEITDANYLKIPHKNRSILIFNDKESNSIKDRKRNFIVAKTDDASIVSIQLEPMPQIENFRYVKSEIDSIAYFLDDEQRGFGVISTFESLNQDISRKIKVLSLHLASDKRLNNVLRNFVIEEEQVSIDGNCEGYFNFESYALSIDPKIKNNGLHNINVVKTTTRSKNVLENGNCERKNINKETTEKQLVFDGKTYK